MISLHETFTDAIDGLPKDIKTRVMNTISKFMKDSSITGLNLEKIKAKDQDMYSIRVNDDYRIICKVYAQKTALFLYVGKHDAAYDWAGTHSVTIDGAGIISVSVASPDVKTQMGGKNVSRLNALTDQEMDELDIRPSFRSQLREKVFFKNQLIGFKQYLSDETYMVLEDILNGNDKNAALDFYREIKAETIIPILSTEPLFNISSEALSKIGVPSDKIDLVKSVYSVEKLKSIQTTLPSHAVEALYKYIDGIPLSEIISSCVKGNKPVNEDKIDLVLSNPGSKQHVVTVDDQEELERLFNMPMEKWRVFLHPEQRRIVEAVYNGPARVIGGAGTGKTVVVIHRAKELAKKCPKKARILVTSFSKTLADDIVSRLRLICNDEEMSKITVGTFDSVTKDYLQLFSTRYIKYDEGGKSPLRMAWEEACKVTNYHDFDIDFYIAEWRDVFQGQKIRSKEEYLNIPRKGKGNKRLTKAARERVFQVFTEYQNFMQKKNWIDIDWAQNLCAEILPTKSDIRLFEHILVDECQDFTSAAFRLLRVLAGPEHSDDLFLAGDSRQRIYNGHSSLLSCGIIVNNRSYQIKINYRTTREIYDLSLKLQKGYNYDNLDDTPIEKDESVPTKHGDLPIIKGFKTWKEEQKAVIENVKKRIKEGYIPSEICIVAKERRIAYSLAKELSKQGVDSLYLANNQSDDKTIVGVRTATMHRVKGMEYDCVYVISANADLLPYKKEYNNPDNEKTDLIRILKKDANLLSVAITRARKNVWVSYFGEPTILLKNVLHNNQ